MNKNDLVTLKYNTVVITEYDPNYNIVTLSPVKTGDKKEKGYYGGHPLFDPNVIYVPGNIKNLEIQRLYYWTIKLLDYPIGMNPETRKVDTNKLYKSKTGNSYIKLDDNFIETSYFTVVSSKFDLPEEGFPGIARKKINKNPKIYEKYIGRTFPGSSFEFKIIRKIDLDTYQVVDEKGIEFSMKSRHIKTE